ncbi:MAG: hypothetical protein ABI628_10575 [Chloroflexota bacterium]
MRSLTVVEEGDGNRLVLPDLRLADPSRGSVLREPTTSASVAIGNVVIVDHPLGQALVALDVSPAAVAVRAAEVAVIMLGNPRSRNAREALARRRRFIVEESGQRAPSRLT